MPLVLADKRSFFTLEVLEETVQIRIQAYAQLTWLNGYCIIMGIKELWDGRVLVLNKLLFCRFPSLEMAYCIIFLRFMQGLTRLWSV